jgi:drug/metabolite transporter (DMT)-like permease
MNSDSYRDEDRHGRAALPGAALVALLGGCALLVVAAIVTPRLLPQLPMTTLLGAGAALGLLSWLVALPAGLRRAGIAGRRRRGRGADGRPYFLGDRPA